MDEAIHGTAQAKPLPWLMACLREAPHARSWILATIGVGTAAGGLIVLQAYLVARIVGDTVMGGSGLRNLAPWFAVLAAVIAARAILAWARGTCGFHAGAAVRRKVRERLMDHIARLGPAYTEGRGTGALAATVIEQVEALDAFYSHFLPQMALAVLVPALIVCAVFPVSWAAGGLLLVTAPLIPLFMVLVGMGAENISQRNFQAMARLGAHFLDTLQGLTTLKLFNRSRGEGLAVAAAAREYRKRTMQVLRLAFLSSAVLEFFAALSIALVAIFLGLRYLGYLQFGTWDSPLTLSHGLFILVLAPDFYQPLRELGTQYHARAEAVGAATEILAVFSVPLTANTEISKGSFQIPATPRLCGRDLYLCYPGRKQAALAGVGFSLGPGEHVAVVGASGSGKSSLLKLLLRFADPDSGELWLNDTLYNGVLPDDWRKAMAWVGQDPVLFYGTIRENILAGAPRAAESQLLEAARAAAVTDFALRLPLGLDTPVGERGLSLSRGQSQRVALARALLKNAPILLLDEPTAGLDRYSEFRILEALQHSSRGKTMVMTTHRLAGLESMDRILVMENGRISAQGSYTELAAGDPGFADLMRRADSGENG
ncbi:MAG: thiol reductant ABC exporter subunit CydD [Desulfobacteraceae bacterium]|nr:thiol reductant ABC exporter subunit CydD [Desulfobacteraceae bacterium]